MTDNETLELVRLVQKGDENAFGELASRFGKMIYSMAKSAAGKLDGISENPAELLDDLKQEANLALYRAAAGYDESKMGSRVSFGLFAKICVRNALISYIRKASAKKRRVQKTFAAGGETAASELYTAESDAVKLSELLGNSTAVLSDYEKFVLDEYLKGKSPRKIAAEAGKSPKSVSNALFRLRQKIRDFSRIGK